jgi:hypothetical protein
MIGMLQALQDTALSTWLRESTWGYPLLAALHVLGIAWFGGAVLLQIEKGRRAGLTFMTATGLILFYMSPVRCAESWPFWIKMALLAVAAWPRCPRAVSLTCWTGMIFAARWIAFF